MGSEAGSVLVCGMCRAPRAVWGLGNGHPVEVEIEACDGCVQAGGSWGSECQCWGGDYHLSVLRRAHTIWPGPSGRLKVGGAKGFQSMCVGVFRPAWPHEVAGWPSVCV